MFNKRVLSIGFGALAASLSLTLPSGAPATAQSAKPIDLQFVNHIQAQLPEQDVFIVTASSTDGKLVRVEVDAVKLPASMATMIYASTAPVEHDPSNSAPARSARSPAARRSASRWSSGWPGRPGARMPSTANKPRSTSPLRSWCPTASTPCGARG